MNDQRDIPLPSEELHFKVRIYAIIDQQKKEYEQLSTGVIQITTDQEQDEIVNFLEVKNQPTKQVLLISRIRLSNNYGTQKGTIISWTDPDQSDSEDIAISFQRQEECQIYWRLICQKIGKNYLEINGQEKLQMPNQNNLQQNLQKVKNSTDMVNYHIEHSDEFLTALSRTYDILRKNNDQMGMGTVLRIVKALMSTYNLKVVEAFLRGQHFYMLLDLQTFKYNIKFKEIYEQNVGKYLNNKFFIPKQVYEKIQISHRAIFYRQNAINLCQQGALQSSMLMITKQVSLDIISYLNKGDVLAKIINCNDYSDLKDQNISSSSQNLQLLESSKQIKQVRSQSNLQIQQKFNELNVEDFSKKQRLVNDKVTFVLQAFAIYKHLTSENMKIRFIQKIYASEVMQFLKNILNESKTNSIGQSQKLVQVLIYICQADRYKFFAYLIESFKNNSTDNLLRTLTKKYISSPSLRQSILILIQSCIPMLNQKVENLEFLNGTFLCLVFGSSKDFQGILLLISLLVNELLNVSILYGYLIKSKVFQKIATQYRSGIGMKTKRQQLLIIKILKSILIEQSKQKTPKVQQMQKVILESGYLDICMIVYLKHSLKYNIISSSMLENFKLIQKMPYSLIDEHLVKQYSTTQGQIKKIIQPLKLKYIEHQNQLQKIRMFKEVRTTDRKVHDQLLQNQMQDSYLMGEDSDSEKKQIDIKSQAKNIQSQQFKRQREELELEEMKKMRDQLSNKNEDEAATNIRKQVKKSQDSRQTAILSFQLPQWDEEDLQNTYQNLEQKHQQNEIVSSTKKK